MVCLTKGRGDNRAMKVTTIMESWNEICLSFLLRDFLTPPLCEIQGQRYFQKSCEIETSNGRRVSKEMKGTINMKCIQ